MSSTKYYEDPDDLMFQLRSLVVGDRIEIPFYKRIDRNMTWMERFNDGIIPQANPYLDAVKKKDAELILMIIADFFYAMKLSVTLEIFTKEAGFDEVDFARLANDLDTLKEPCHNRQEMAIECLIRELRELPVSCPPKDYVKEVWEYLGQTKQFVKSKRAPRSRAAARTTLRKRIDETLPVCEYCLP